MIRDFSDEQYSNLVKIQNEVSSWSRKNFGEQHYTNPLLGVAEEAGEFFEAETIDETIDASADAMIFMMDFIGRLNHSDIFENSISISSCISLALSDEKNMEAFKQHGIFNAIPIFTGKVMHSVLKSRQGIRKGESHEINLRYSIGNLFLSYDRVLNYISEEHEGPSNLFDAIQSTWNRVVSKRDWTPETKVVREEDHGTDI